MIGNDIIIQCGLVISVLILGYIFLVRPQINRSKENQKVLNSLRIGDRVFTSAGLIGKVAKFVGTDIVEIDLSNAMRIEILKSSINGIYRERYGEVSIVPAMRSVVAPSSSGKNPEGAGGIEALDQRQSVFY